MTGSKTTSAAPGGSPGSGIVFPEVRMHDVRPTSPVAARVVKNELCTASRKSAGFVRHVEIDVSGTPLENAVRAGQSFGVIPPGVDEKGRAHKARLYSLASPTRGEDGAGRVISTTVKRTIDEHWDDHRLFLGVASNHLCDLAEGDEVRVSGPNGKRFLLPERVGEHDYVFFATGTGIAPFRGMVLDLLEAGATSSVTLVMGAPYETDLLYHDDFLRTASERENFRYITALSRQGQADGAGPMYVQGRLETHRDVFDQALSSDRTLVYVCGIAGMELGIFQGLARLLAGDELAQYLAVGDDALANIDGWERRMIHKAVKPTRRVFLEVY